MTMLRAIVSARRLAAWSAVGFLLPAVAAAQSSPAITVTEAWARRAPAAHGAGPGSHAGATGAHLANGAVYATLSNGGAAADALVAAASDAARTVELHEVRHEGGVMAMRPVARMPLPAGGTLQMKPGGYHVMLLGLTRDLHPGERLEVVLTFEKSPPVTIQVPVR